MLTEDDQVVLFMRPGCHVCARVKKYLIEHDIPFSVRDVDSEPLTPRELWDIFNRKANRLRVPFTVLNDGADVVLGYDPIRLDGVFRQGDHGGWQASTRVHGERVYDDFTDSELSAQRWLIETGLASAARTGDGQVTAALPVELDGDERWSSVSAERFATPPGSHVMFEVRLSVSQLESVASVDEFATVSVRDIAGGITLGYRITGSTVYAVHERQLIAGVTLPEEQFAHRVVTDVATVSGQQHHYAIRYRHDSGAIEWHVDGVCVYWATAPRPMEGCSLGMQLRGRSVTAQWSPWTISSL